MYRLPKREERRFRADLEREVCASDTFEEAKHIALLDARLAEELL